MGRFVLVLAFVGMLFAPVSAAHSNIVVAEWISFDGPPSAATGGQQTGTALFSNTFSGFTDVGPTFVFKGTGDQFDAANANVSVVRVNNLAEFVLTYDVLREDHVGANSAPTQVNWSYSVDANAFSFLTSKAISSGANSHTVDFSMIPAINTGASLVFRATFTGAIGPDGSRLTFDNVRVTAIPEPASALSITAISVGIMIFHRRKNVACRKRVA